MKKAVIITSYIEYPFDNLRKITEGTYVICTDGGYDIASSQGIRPDLFLGDFDSLKTSVPEDIPIIQFKPEKNYTDLELAIKTACDDGYDEVEIIGGIGGRFDHTVANIQLLSCYCRKFRSIFMHDALNCCFALHGSAESTVRIPSLSQTYLSVFSLTEKCTGISVQGVKYPLDNYTLTSTFPLGVSNEFNSDEAVISVKEGTLLIILSKENK